ncbi:threonine ammonia-lyase, biosynthetic, partial [Candidatus Saccharibacteria bacterium]|nr:threonine ammonia-lyase, biosynthetic [Candidatus Saccharibacteria bacterium]
FIHPFDDPLVIAGQGTIGREILEQLPDVTHIFVPVGGGGLLAGISQYVKALRPETVIVGVEPVDSAAMTKSLAADRRVRLAHVGIFADGVAVKQVGEYAFQTAKQLVDDCITVTTDQICAAIKDTYEATRSIVEPAGALALAGLKTYDLPSDAQAIAICSGANVSFERLQQIAERTQIGSGKEALFAIEMPETPGSLHTFCEVAVHDRNISEFAYRLRGRGDAHVLVGLTVKDTKDRQLLMNRIRQHGFGCEDMSDDDLAKEHVRHMVGGTTGVHTTEALYLVDFPERPGALSEFLAHMADKWNISMFHYRSTASDIGSVLIGFETKQCAKLEEHLKNTGLDYKKVDTNRALQLFC